jgi:hypothetical protein
VEGVSLIDVHAKQTLEPGYGQPGYYLSLRIVANDLLGGKMRTNNKDVGCMVMPTGTHAARLARESIVAGANILRDMGEHSPGTSTVVNLTNHEVLERSGLLRLVEPRRCISSSAERFYTEDISIDPYLLPERHANMNMLPVVARNPWHMLELITDISKVCDTVVQEERARKIVKGNKRGSFSATEHDPRGKFRRWAWTFIDAAMVDIREDALANGYSQLNNVLTMLDRSIDTFGDFSTGTVRVADLITTQGHKGKYDRADYELFRSQLRDQAVKTGRDEAASYVSWMVFHIFRQILGSRLASQWLCNSDLMDDTRPETVRYMLALTRTSEWAGAKELADVGDAIQCGGFPWTLHNDVLNTMDQLADLLSAYVIPVSFEDCGRHLPIEDSLSGLLTDLGFDVVGEFVQQIHRVKRVGIPSNLSDVSLDWS